MIYGWFDINKNMNLNCHSTIPSCKPNMHCINNNLPPPLHMANHIMAQVLQIFGSLNMKHDKSASFNWNTRSKGRAALVKLSPKFTRFIRSSLERTYLIHIKIWSPAASVSSSPCSSEIETGRSLHWSEEAFINLKKPSSLVSSVFNPTYHKYSNPRVNILAKKQLSPVIRKYPVFSLFSDEIFWWSVNNVLNWADAANILYLFVLKIHFPKIRKKTVWILPNYFAKRVIFQSAADFS